MFWLVQLEDGKPNRMYKKKKYLVGLDDSHGWLALPNGISSAKKTIANLKTGKALVVEITVCCTLGWQFIMLNVLYFRAVYLQIITIPSEQFPANLPKDNIVDGMLVLMVTSWLSHACNDGGGFVDKPLQ